MADRGLTSPQLQQIAQQAQISIELLEVDWEQTSGINAQGRTDGYLTIAPGAATTLKYGNADTWAACTQTGTINIISTPVGTETVDYLKRIAFKWDGAWKASIGYTLERGYITVSDANPTITALIEGGKFYIQLHYNSEPFYLYDSTNNLITSTSVIKHDYGMDFCFSNGTFPVTYNSKLFLPLGTWISFSEIEENIDFQITDITIALNGIDYIHSRQNGETYGFDYWNYDADYQSYEGDPNSKYAVTKLNNPVWRFLLDNYVGRRVRIYRAFLNQSYSMVGNPLLIFEGEMTKPVVSINPDGGTTVAVVCSNQWKDFERRNGRRTNFKEQKSWAMTNLGLDDFAFEFTYQNTSQIRWGQENPVVNPPTNLRYTKTEVAEGTYFNFMWTAPKTAVDQYEIWWKQPNIDGSPKQVYQSTTTYWKSPLVPTGESFSISVYSIKDGVRSKATIEGSQTGAGVDTGQYPLPDDGSGYGGYYGYDYQQYDQP